MGDSEVGSVSVEIRLLLGYARALHRAGAPTPRVEALLATVGRAIGVPGRFFGVPTALIASLEVDGRPETHVVEVEGGDIDLGALARLEAIAARLTSGEAAAGEALAQLEAGEQAPPRWSAATTVAAFAGVSGAAAIVLGGGAAEGAVAAAAGLSTGLLAVGSAGRLFELLAAAQAAFLATSAARWAGVAVEPAVLGGLIVLVPGFTLWQGMAELTCGHLVSGTTRLARALAVLLLMGVGFALGSRVADALVPELASPVVLSVASIPTALAVAATAPALLVLFRAPARELGWILGSVGVAWGGSMLGGQSLGPELGTFIAALGVGLYGGVYERLARRPAAVAMVPGIWLLVPGTIGFRGINALMADDPVAGIEAGFSALLVAVSLVAGLLVAETATYQRTPPIPGPP